jgi:uncharacterized membrane protein required for colicin V production
MHINAILPTLSGLPVNYVDILVVAWLIIGLFYGRKRGMTQELLPTLQWLAIVIVAGLYYKPLALMIRQQCHFEPLWSNIFAYILIAFGIHLVYLWIKQMLHQRLIGTDMFGRGEYYLGMLSGMVHFGCMFILLCALMNSRIITRAELAKTEKLQGDAFSDIRFPTYGSVQQAVLFQSLTGSLIETNLNNMLIATVPVKLGLAKAGGSETPKQQQERLINEVLGVKKQ